MDINKLRKILQRYLQGKANETESALVEAWYRSYGSNEQTLNSGKVDELRDAIKLGIRKAIKKRSIFYMPIFRVAASVAIFSILGFFGWRLARVESTAQQEYTTLTTGIRGVKKLTLPDGSIVWLNAVSRIEVPATFNKKLREVVLVEGEAFFNVMHDPKLPFIVRIAPLNVQVLGTSFNIRAYQDLRTISVAVATGKVAVSGKSKTPAMLLPGQQLSYNVDNGKTEQQTIDADQMQSWKKGVTYLNQASFKELAVIVKNIYDLSIKAGNKKVGGYRFSLRLIHNLPPEQILDLITQLHHTRFRKEGNDLIFY